MKFVSFKYTKTPKPSWRITTTNIPGACSINVQNLHGYDISFRIDQKIRAHPSFKQLEHDPISFLESQKHDNPDIDEFLKRLKQDSTRRNSLPYYNYMRKELPDFYQSPDASTQSTKKPTNK